MDTILAIQERVSNRAKKFAYVRSHFARELASKLIVNRRRDTVELSGLYPWLNERLGDWCMITEWVLGGATIDTSDLKLPKKIEVPFTEALGDKIRLVRAEAG